MKYSSTNVCTEEEIVSIQKYTNRKPNISNTIIRKWQDILDLISLNINVPSVLIMCLDEKQIDVFLTSNTKGNPYKEGEKTSLLSGLYRETVASNKAGLLVPNALTDPLWGRSLDIKLNLISYLGFPILWSDGEVFGTICALDNKENHYNIHNIQLMEILRDSIEKDLKLLLEQELLKNEFQNRNRAEQKRRESETIELGKFNTEFFANISHELRTPLNIILGSIQIIIMMIQDSEKPINKNKIINNINIQKQNCHRMLRLINNLIDSYKLDTVNPKLNMINCNVVSLVEEITQSVAEYINNSNLTLIFDTDIEEKIIACDIGIIERIMLNLLSNSIKFTEQGGSIFVKVFGGNDYITITVEDNGIGIPKDELDGIFDRFRQVDKSFTRNHEGSGIGLSIVKSLIEMHDGTISVESKYGVGTRFRIRLPVRVMASENSEEKSKFKNNTIDNCVERIKIEFSDIYKLGT